MRKRLAGCLLIAAFVGLLFGSAFHMANVYMERNQTFQEREQVLIQEIHKEQKALEELLVRADTVLMETTSEQLTDPFLLVQLEQQVFRGETDQKPEPKDTKTSEDYLEEYQELTASLDYNGALKKDLEQDRSRISQTLQNLQSSKDEKSFQNAKASLETAIQSAKEFYTSSVGKVADEGTRTLLQEEITRAETLLGEEKPEDFVAAAGQILDMQSELESAKGSVQASIEEQERIDASIWYVDYYTDYFTVEADPNGAVTQWGPDYFIAHSWSDNGKRIASKVPYVVVDGVTYHYISSRIFPQITYWDELEAFACVNGGIGFQTCYGDALLVTHYEPN